MLYGLVKQTTCNFTKNTTRNNCAKINYVNLCTKMKYADDFSVGKQQQQLKHIKDYFSHTRK